MTRIALKLIDAQMLTRRVRSLRFVARDGADLPAWTPGAHVEFVLPDGTERPYSLMPSLVTEYRIAVLLETDSAGGSVQMHALKIGDHIDAAAPKNDFEMRSGANPALFVAGGIGITPMPAMMQAACDAGADATLFYCGQSQADMAFADDLAETFQGKMTVHADDAVGSFPDFPALVAKHSAAHLYICGPRPMIDAARAAADSAGIAPDQIHVELFEAKAAEDGDAPFDVVIASTGDQYTVPAGQSIIDVLEAAGHDLMYDCQRGDCGICQTDVIEGVPDHRDVVLSQSEKDAGTVMQICVSRAKSAKLVLDL